MKSSEYSVPVPSDRTAILCLHCGKPQEVGRKAMSVTCRFCSKPLKIEDVKITRYEARRVIETCGTVTIDKKGHVVSDVRCVSLILKGKLKGDVVSLSKVEVASDAELKGDVTATSLSIEPGAMMEGFYRIGPKPTDPPPAKVAEGAKQEVVAANPEVAEPAGEAAVAPAPAEAPKAPIVIKVPVRKTATVTRRQ
jgi:hypothetical protein